MRYYRNGNTVYSISKHKLEENALQIECFWFCSNIGLDEVGSMLLQTCFHNFNDIIES